MGIRSIISGVIVLFGLTVCPGVSAAGPKEDAEAAIARGIAYRKEGDDGRALEQFQKAYQLDKTPKALAQIGLAQMALGHWVESYTAIEGALAAPADAWIQKNRTTLQGLLEQVGRHLGEVEVEGDPPGARVSLNGVAAGTIPLRTRVAAGDVVISVEAPGRVSLTRKINVEPTGRVRESFTLPPASGKTEPTTVSAPPTVAARSPQATTTSVPTVGTTSSPERPRRFGQLPWWTAGAAVVALGTGTTFAIIAQSRLSDFNGSCGLVPGTDMPMRDPALANPSTDAQCASLYDDWKADKRWATVGFVAGGVLAAGSALLLLLNSEEQGASTTKSASACIPTTTGIACAMRF